MNGAREGLWMNVAIQTVSNGGDHVLFVKGEIDAYSGPELKEKLLSLVAQAHRVTVDMSGVEYMDSTGIGIFIGALKSCKKTGCQLFMQNLSPRVERLFRITGLLEYIVLLKGENA
jgi:anti-sigma B factor antagonist